MNGMIILQLIFFYALFTLMVKIGVGSNALNGLYFYPEPVLDKVYELDVRPASDSCEYYIPVWKDDQADLFTLSRVPDADAGTDVGSLKGIIMSRGDWVANYTDIPIAPKAPVRPIESGYENDAEYQSALLQYQTDYNNYQIEYPVFDL